MLFKNIASQNIHVYSYNSTTGAPQTGDSANTTAYISLDGASQAVASGGHPTEVDSTNMPGVYVFSLAQSDTNSNSFALYAKSTTANIRIQPIIGFTTAGAIPNAVAGANGGLPTTNGTVINQTVNLTANQSIACSDKTGFALANTGADLILSNSTFITAIVSAINGLATYGLTALNTLLVTTGIKASSVPAVTVTTNNDKTGYSLSATGGDLILSSSTFITAIVTAINNLATYGLTALNTLLVTTGIKAASTPNDSNITAIKAKTDQLAFTVANQVDANALTGGGGLNAAGVRAAVGLASANLDTQLSSTPGAVWDVALSGHVISGSSGAALSAAGTAGDPWITVLPGAYAAGTAGYRVGHMASLGSGTISWPITVTSGGVVQEGVEVWVSTDSAGVNIVASGWTANNGIVTFALNAGNYFVWCQKSGVNFTNPIQITVS